MESIHIEFTAPIVFIVCATIIILVIFFTYCILPVSKVKVVNGAMVSLIKVLPISKIINAFKRRLRKNKKSRNKDQEEL